MGAYKRQNLPRPVFKVHWRNGEPELHEARLVAVRGSWRHIRLPNGNLLKNNGCGTFVGESGWQDSAASAWVDAAMQTAFQLRIFGDEHVNEYLERVEKVARAAMHYMYEVGELMGQIRNSTSGEAAKESDDDT